MLYSLSKDNVSVVYCIVRNISTSLRDATVSDRANKIGYNWHKDLVEFGGSHTKNLQSVFRKIGFVASLTSLEWHFIIQILNISLVIDFFAFFLSSYGANWILKCQLFEWIVLKLERKGSCKFYWIFILVNEIMSLMSAKKTRILKWNSCSSRW